MLLSIPFRHADFASSVFYCRVLMLALDTDAFSEQCPVESMLALDAEVGKKNMKIVIDSPVF